MPNAGKTVTIFGGSGFIGRYVARRLALQGWRVRVAVRRPNESLFVRTFGAVGQVEPVLANVRDDASTREAIRGSDAVVNCVGLLAESGKQKFDALHVKAAGRIAKLAREEGVASLVHISSLSADAASNSSYARTKAEGEALVTAEFPSAVILRPSVMFGPEDKFFNKFAWMARFTFVLPVVGAKTLFQPVYVDDVAKAAVLGVTGEAPAGVYEIGGPAVLSFRELMQGMLKVVRRRRAIINMPFWVARVLGWGFDLYPTMTRGLIVNRILTRDQARLLAHDNIVDESARKLSDLGIEPTPMEAILETYLYIHRAEGQFTALRESAKNIHAR